MKTSRSYFSVLFILSVFSIPLFAAPPEGKGKPPKPPDDGGDPAECSYPSFSDVPKEKLRGAEADFSGNYGLDVARFNVGTAEPIFEETGLFDAGWFVEDMTDRQHRTGNEGISETGGSCGVDCTPVGKRLSAWYDYTGSALSGTESYGGEDSLWLGGKIEPTPSTDPTRPPAGQKWYENRLYTTWLSTLQRQFQEFGTRKPGVKSFKPPMYLKTRVNFEKMQTPGFRLSMWLMPVEEAADLVDGFPPDPSIAYDGNPGNGFEMDIFEFEPVSVIRNVEDPLQDKICGNTIEFAWINSFATKGKSAREASGKNHFEGLEEGYCTDRQCDDTYANPNGMLRDDINKGWHTIEFLWVLNHNETGEPRIVWAFNNEIVLEITDPAKIPDADREHYLIVSREMTNGLTSGADIYDGVDTFLPPEGGLYGWNGNSNIGDYFDKIDADRALIDYIEIYEIP